MSAPVATYARDGRRLLDTSRGGKIRHWLINGQVRVISPNPFAVQLLFDPEGVVCDLPEGVVSPPKLQDPKPHQPLREEINSNE